MSEQNPEQEIPNEDYLDHLDDDAFMRQTASMLPQAAADPEPEIDRSVGGVLEDRLAAPPMTATEDAAEEETGDEGEDASGGDEGNETETLEDATTAGAQPAEGGVESTTVQNQAQRSKAGGTATADADAQPDEPEESVAAAADYEALYKQVMAPFKANGREFTPSSPEEAVRLMQMGANYTKKMQALKPNLKLLRMLENNGLLQEEKLSFLIDLDKKNPQAIQKLLHDGQVDPLDLDPSAAPTYTPGNHSVSDAEVDFVQAVESVSQTPSGKETIRHIDTSWDPESKRAVYQEPALLEIIDQQRANGLYDLIAGEVERRRILGEFTNTPFIQAYKTVGDALHAQGKLAPQNATTVAPSYPASAASPVQALETRPGQKRKPTASREQVRAVTPAPGSKTVAARRAFDPLSMSDEEIMAVPVPFN